MPRLDAGYVSSFPKSETYCLWGVAILGDRLKFDSRNTLASDRFNPPNSDSPKFDASGLRNRGTVDQRWFWSADGLPSR